MMMIIKMTKKNKEMETEGERRRGKRMKKTEETEKGRGGHVYAEWYNPDNEVAVRTETNKKENDVNGRPMGE